MVSIGRAVCVDCAENKHGACNGEAITEWDDDSLTLGACACAEAGHIVPPPYAHMDEH